MTTLSPSLMAWPRISVSAVAVRRKQTIGEVQRSISSVADSQIFAMQAAMVATYLPALLLSGFLFDIAGMPLVLRGITYLIPARYFVVVTRGVLLKGVGLGALWPQAVAMLIFAIVGLTLATRVFKKEIRV